VWRPDKGEIVNEAYERERFEMIAKSNGWLHPLHGTLRMDHGGYLDNYLQYRWEAFQVGKETGESRRKHTQDWYAEHYGKLEDWARKILPEPWRTQFFNCIANGTYDAVLDVGEPYMSQVGLITPSGYFRMDTAAEQLLRDQTIRVEEAEAALASALRREKEKM
jgi:hypothetical protein